MRAPCLRKPPISHTEMPTKQLIGSSLDMPQVVVPSSAQQLVIVIFVHRKESDRFDRSSLSPRRSSSLERGIRRKLRPLAMSSSPAKQTKKNETRKRREKNKEANMKNVPNQCESPRKSGKRSKYSLHRPSKTGIRHGRAKTKLYLPNTGITPISIHGLSRAQENYSSGCVYMIHTKNSARCYIRQ